MNKVNCWIKALRLPFLTGSVLPVCLGAAMAYASQESFKSLLFGATLLAVILLHSGANLINDYFDHKTGADEANRTFISPFTGGSRVIQEKLLSPKEILRGAIFCFTLSGLLGFYLFWQTGLLVLVLGAIGLFSALFYATPSLSLLNLGIGELVIALNFGILPTLGSYFIQTGHGSTQPVLASIPLGIIIACLLFINEFQDYDSDKATGKKTIVVRLGRKKSSFILAFLLLGAFLGQTLLTLLESFSALTLLPLFTLPFLFVALYFCLHFAEQPRRLVPANMAVLFLHLFFALFLILSFLKDKLSHQIFTVIFVALFFAQILCLPIIFHQSKKYKLSGDK